MFYIVFLWAFSWSNAHAKWNNFRLRLVSSIFFFMWTDCNMSCCVLIVDVRFSYFVFISSSFSSSSSSIRIRIRIRQFGLSLKLEHDCVCAYIWIGLKEACSFAGRIGWCVLAHLWACVDARLVLFAVVVHNAFFSSASLYSRLLLFVFVGSSFSGFLFLDLRMYFVGGMVGRHIC